MYAQICVSFSWILTLDPSLYLTTNMSNLFRLYLRDKKTEQTFKKITGKQQCSF